MMYNVHLPISRSKLKQTVLMLASAMYVLQPVCAAASPAVTQLPTGGQVVVGQATINQSGANMNITQSTNRAAINWQSFDIGSGAQVNFNQPSADSVALNRVLNGNPSQIFGNLTANGQVFITNGAGMYFAPGASVNVGALVATTHSISDDDFMNGVHHFTRDGAEGSIVNEGTITVDLGKYVALLAPEVRNEGVIIAQMGTVALAAGEAYELQFNGEGGLADITVAPSDIAMLVENKQVIQAPGGLVLLSAQAVNHLQGGVVRNSGSIEAAGLVDDGGIVRLVASDAIELGGEIDVSAAADSSGNGGEVLAIASLDNPESTMEFSGHIVSRGGEQGGDGGFVETSGSHVTLRKSASVDTKAPAGKTGKWLVDPYDYTIDADAASAIVTSLASSNVEVTTAIDNSSHGSDGVGTGDIDVTSAISSDSSNTLTLTADNAITIGAAVSTYALILNGPGGITLSDNLTTVADMTLNGDVTLGAAVTLTSGISNTYTTYTTYVVPEGVTSVTATLVGGSGGRGGTDGGNQGGSATSAGTLTASFDVTSGQNIYIAPGSGGGAGTDSAGSAAGGAGGTNNFNLGNGGAGGTGGPTGSSGGGGGGGAATVISLTSTPDANSDLLVAAGGGGGGGAGNNTACPSLCGDQTSTNYRTDSSMTGETGKNAGNGGTPINDGGASGGGGGGVLGGKTNDTVFFVDEWTGRGGNVGSSGAANDFTTTSLSTSILTTTSSQSGYATISYGGGTIDINGTVNGGYGLTISSPSGDVDISGAVGGDAALASLNIAGSQGIAFAGGAVTTTGAQTYTGPVALNANDTAFSTTSNGAVTFAGDIVKGSGVNSNLSVSTGSGAVSFNGQTGTSENPIGTVSVNTTGTTSIAGALYATSLSKLGSGKTTISGGLVQTTGGQSYTGLLDLGGDATLSSTGTGNITLNNAVVNNNQSDLTIIAADGDVTLSGNLAVGTNDRPTPIGDVSITASGTVTLGSSGSPISVDAQGLSITADTVDIYANSSTSFTCGTGASVTGICLTTATSIDVASASTFSGPLSGTTSFTKSGAGSLTLTGVNTYSGNTTVDEGKLEIGGSGKLGNGSYGGDINVTGQVRFATSANQVLTGTMSGDGFINSPGSGTLDITTLSNADYYNLAVAYIAPKSDVAGSSSFYGSAPNFTYQLTTASGGGVVINDADPSGTVVLSGAPTDASDAGNYTISYVSGISLGSERYTLQTGTNLSWTIAPRPLNLTVSKIYDGTALFNRAFSVSGLVNDDAAPSVSGSANAASATAGTYTSFASNSLVLDSTNYTLTGGSISATIVPRPPTSSTDVTVTLPRLDIPKLGNEVAVLELPGANIPGGEAFQDIIQLDKIEVLTYNAEQPFGRASGGLEAIPVSNNKIITRNEGRSTTDTRAGNVQNRATNIVGGTAEPITRFFDASGIVVSFVNEPSVLAKGVVNVAIPKEVIDSTNGFTFELPKQTFALKGADASSLTASMSNGDPLPKWIKFNAGNKTFVAENIPTGGLPLNIILSADGEKFTIVISQKN